MLNNTMWKKQNGGGHRTYRKRNIFLILFTFLMCIGISYAIWQFSYKEEEQNVVSSACFKVNFEEVNDIELENAYPITNEEGMKLTPYEFTITNVCDTYARYQVNLEVLMNSTLSSDYIKIYLEGLEPNVLETLTKTNPTLENAKESFLLTTGYLTKEKSVTYHLRLWMDYDTPPDLEVMNKIFQSKITVVSTYVSEIENQIKNQVISLNTEYAKDEKFEIHISSEVVDIVETSLDNVTWNKLESSGKEVVIETTVTSSGKHEIYVKDAANNVFVVPFVANKVDDLPPIVEVNPISDIKKITIDASKSQDPQTSITNYYYSLDGKNWHTSTNSSYTFENLQNKEYKFYIKVEDQYGNISEVKEVKATPQLAGTDYIININNQEQLVYDGTVDNNLRYIGPNPDNYVTFNNELWRIIGVMNNIDDGNGNKASRIKIIRNSSIGEMKWNDSNCSVSVCINWSKATLKTYLNETYYSSIVQKDRLIIDEVQWNLGGTPANEAGSSKTASGWYTLERGTVVYGSNPKTWTGKIALIYPSDYAFSTNGTGTVAGRNTCINTSTRNWRNNWGSCTKNAWIYLLNMFCITPNSSQGNVIRINVYPSAQVHYAANPIKPVLYLKPNVKIVSGNGKSTDPYILSL